MAGVDPGESDKKKRLMTSTAPPPTPQATNDGKPDEQTTKLPRPRGNLPDRRAAPPIRPPTIHARQGDRGSGEDAAAPPRWTRNSGPLLPKRLVAQRYGVCVRTIDRWVANAELGFAQPININGRQYFHERKLEEFEIRRAAAAA